MSKLLVFKNFASLVLDVFLSETKNISFLADILNIYSREHPPPHFHAIFAEYEELIKIETLETFFGEMPKAQRKKVIHWATNNKNLLSELFNQLNPGL